jgi:cytochrome bd-type quinol oxidase subunit 1
MLQLAVSYPLAQIACSGAASHQQLGALHVISAGAFAGVCAAAFSSWRMSRQEGDERHHFMTVLSLLMSGLFAFVVLATWMPQLLLHCEG